MGLFFIPSTVLQAIFSAADTFSDLVLAARHLAKNHFWWGGGTLGCVLVPWIIFLAVASSLWRLSHSPGSAFDKKITFVLLVLAMVNLYPAGILFLAVWQQWKGYPLESKLNFSLAIVFRLVEVTIESFPQSALQVYIVGQTNQLDFLTIFSIATSLWSLGSGIFHGTFRTIEKVHVFIGDYVKKDGICQGCYNAMKEAIAEVYRDPFDYHYATRHETLLALIFQPWVLLHIISLVPPVALLASLKNHTSPATSVVIVYLFVHLPLALTASNIKRAVPRLFFGIIL